MPFRIPMSEPCADVCDGAFEMHGVTVNDDYAWLRNDEIARMNTDADPAIMAHLKAENDYVGAFTSSEGRGEWKKDFYERLVSHTMLDDVSTISRRANYEYYFRMEREKPYPIHCRKLADTPGAKEELVVDVNQVGEGHPFCNVTWVKTSPSQKFVAYDADFTGGEFFTIFVRDMETGVVSEVDVVPNTLGGPVWHPDSNGFFYCALNNLWRPLEVRFHRLGSPVEEDVLIYKEDDDMFTVGIEETATGGFLTIQVSGYAAHELHVMNMHDPSFTVTLVHKRLEPLYPKLDHSGDYFYKRTNEDGATNFKILRAPSEGFDPETVQWSLYRAEEPQRCLMGMILTQNYMLLKYVTDGLPDLVVRSLKTDEEKLVQLPDLPDAFSARLFTKGAARDDIRIEVSDMARPPREFSFDFESGTVKLLKQDIMPGHDPSEYAVERLYVVNMGVRVPISVMYKKSLVEPGNAERCILTGYGSYGVATEPRFRIFAKELADLGFVFAVGHIRGGQDLGLDWYLQAKMLTKWRTFTDLLACGDALIQQGYCKMGEMTVTGRSAGGMLVGVCINERPELFRAAIGHVPFMDTLQTMRDKDFSLTPGEFREWGNPDEEADFHYILSYSPNQNVRQQDYPHVLLTGGLADPRVGFWESAKYAARLRTQKTNDSLVLMRTNMNAGHTGPSDRFAALREMATELVFLCACYGINPHAVQ